MTALNTYVFAPNAFDSDAPLYPYLQMQRRGYNFGGGTEDPKPENDVLALQSTVLYGLMNSTSLSRASRTTLYGNSYSPAAILNEVTSMTFDADLRGDVNLYRQNLQKTYVDMLIGMMKDPKYDNASVSAAYENLKQIRSKLDKLKSGNEQTNAHRGNLKYLIDKALVIK
jgi:DNA repair ATPase RecN